MRLHLYYLMITVVVGWSDAFVSLHSTTTTSTSHPLHSNPHAPHSNFDYLSHWYPVSWIHDLPLFEPCQVTVFDVDYVLARTSDTEVQCLRDVCPHKGAALSQGRVTNNHNHYFQCAYHGWSFDREGNCVEVPQTVQATTTTTTTTKTAVVSSRTAATAVPALVQQEMVWIFPGGRGLEDALQAPLPPRVAEYDDIGFQMSTAVRDMPVDWPIVLSNICDPDHGLFAHQAKNFDMYTASHSHPMEFVEEFPNDGKGYVIRTRVSAEEKLLAVDQELRGNKNKNNKNNKKGPTPIATSVIYLPNHQQLKRINPDTNSTSFVSAFYVCPTGVGRTRFLSAGLSAKAPPRWMTKLFLDNFLDQDTYLLATQEHNILPKEAQELRDLQAELGPDKVAGAPMNTRKRYFCFQSPTEKSVAKLEHFWDATLTRVPNRIDNLLRLDSAGAFLEAKSRRHVLDRESQQLAVCPDAQGTVRNCQRITQVGKGIAKVTLAVKFFAMLWADRSSTALRVSNSLRPALVLAVALVSLGVAKVADKIRSEYFFKYTDDLRRKDLAKIPKTVWMDK